MKTDKQILLTKAFNKMIASVQEYESAGGVAYIGTLYPFYNTSGIYMKGVIVRDGRLILKEEDNNNND